MNKITALETRAWAVGLLPFHLRALPPNHLLRNIKLRVHLEGTKGQAEQIDPLLYPLAIQNVRLAGENPVNCSGYDLDALYRVHNGKIVEQRAAMGGATTSFSIDFTVVVPFRDPRAVTADDSSIPTGLLDQISLDVTMAAANVFSGTSAITSGYIRPLCDCVRSESQRAPELREIGMFEPGGLTALPDPGAYVDLFLCKNDGTCITGANVTNVDVTFDSEKILDNLYSDQVIASHNIDAGVDIVTSGLTWDATNGGTILPIIWPYSADNQITQKPQITTAGAKVQLYGTLTNPHYGYWRAQFKDRDRIANIGRKLGVPKPEEAHYEPRPAKGPLESQPGSKSGNKKFALLAGKFVHPEQLARRVSDRAAGRGK